MFSKLRPRLTYANVVSTVCLFIVLGGSAIAASVITGKNVKNGSLTGKDVKNSSLTGTDVKNKSLTPSDFNGSVQGPKGDTGPEGPRGDKGDTGLAGQDGTDASINGVVAGGDLTGTFPNPTIKAGSVGRAALADGIFERVVLSVPRGTFIDQPGTIGRIVGPGRFKIHCSELGLKIYVQNVTANEGAIFGSYRRAATEAKDISGSLPTSFLHAQIIDTAADTGGSPGNDSGTGTLIADNGVSMFAATFRYEANASSCTLWALMHGTT